MEGPVVLFDGLCNVCSASVRFIVDRDPAGRFRFASLQSNAARNLLAAVPASLPDSIVLLENGEVFVRSAAALRIARGLQFPWPLAWAFIAVPRPLRDYVYDFIAHHRYRWFGKRDVCMVPGPALAARFLTD